MIKLGICTQPEHAGRMKELGYDYIELGLSSVAGMTEEDFARLKAQADAAPLPVYSVNSMLPGHFVLCGAEGTGEAVQAYLETAFKRAAELGVRIAVFGSGGARKRPGDMSETDAYAYLAAFLKLAADCAKPYGIRIAVEPLRSAECNIINRVSEAQQLAALSGADNVAALADLYHMMQEGEGYEALDNGIGIIHAHIAERHTRAYPAEGDGSEADYEEFFRRLKSAGYTGGVSIEGRCSDFPKEAADAFRLLDSLRS